MQRTTNPSTLHRTAKYFMDSGRAGSPEAAVELLHKFGLSVEVGEEIAYSADHQTALLTLVNCARRTFLAGVEVVALPDVDILSPLARGERLVAAVEQLGGTIASAARIDWPSAVVGTVSRAETTAPSWQLTWEGWRGGVIPCRDGGRLSESTAVPIAPALSAALCAAEVFAFHAGDHPMAGRRACGLSLWRPGTDWRNVGSEEPEAVYLPSRLWLIGLGNLGQAFAWLLACLSYPAGAPPLFVVQDFDSVSPANESTSLLTSAEDIGRKKTRLIAEWLEGRGSHTIIEERRFGNSTQRTPDEPGAALCGVDNALARASLEKAGFGLIVEAGLGAGPQGFRNVSLHTFPASRSADQIWSGNTAPPAVESMPAYQAMRRSGLDQCGVAQLASRTVAVPFVGLAAGCLVIAELLRRLNGGTALEVASFSLLAPDDVETVAIEATAYAFGHVAAAAAAPPSAIIRPSP